MPVKTLMCMLAVVLMITPLQAEESDPEMDLFEFLADWESDDGQWVEPSTFEDANTEETGDFPMKTTQEDHYEF